MQKKYVTIPEQHRRYVNESGQTVSAVARRAITELADTDPASLPRRGTRASDDRDYVRTSIRLEQPDLDFIDRNEINLSRTIREYIDRLIETERELQRLEDDPGNLLSPMEDVVTVISFRARRLGIDFKRLNLEVMNRIYEGGFTTDWFEPEESV